MSYILDALRRSEAEHQREQAGVPGLDAQALPPLPGDEAEGTPRRSVWIWLVAGLAAGALMAVMLVRRAPAEVPPAITATPTPVPAVGPAASAVTGRTDAAPAASVPSRTSLPEPIPAEPAAETDNARRVRPAVSSASAESTPSKAIVGSSGGAPPAVPASASAASPRSAEAVPASATAGGPTATPAATAILPLADMPEALRRELPPLAVGGATYSDNPGSRLLILDGQLLREGDRPAAGLTLLQIQLKSAIFDYKGTRFRLSY